MKKKTSRILKYSTIFTIILAIIVPIIIIIQSNNDTGNNDNNTSGVYSWDADTDRLDFAETIENITIKVDYNNGTIEEYNDLNGNGHYTTVFDFLNKTFSVNFDIYHWNPTSFFINEINGKNGDWTFYVDEQYSPVASNRVAPLNNSIIEWKFVG